ncbi:ISAs1 family transposase [Escherichia coli]|uniref:ISAs1 family transposase n=1 Tax=Escherichia coli TaxID=562 RepID=UPI0011BFB352
MELKKLMGHISIIPDYRQAWKMEHKLSDILLLTICAVISGAEGWEDIEDFGETHPDFLKQYGDFENGIPVHDTIARVVSCISPAKFHECFINWMRDCHSSDDKDVHQLQQLIRLPGQQYDEESGLYYNRHRYYDPLQGRYITQDPIGLKGGWNFYQYPLNPVTNTDPLGLEVFPRPFPLPIPWPKSPAQQQADDNAAKALTKWWNDTASQRIFDSLILNNPGLALDITMIASRGNVADTGITDRVNDIINDRFWSDGKKPDRCDVLQELIDCGDISAKDAKSTQKAWNCRHSRQSNDKKR